MDTIFIIRVIISFFVAGIWIGGATLLAERLGSKIGGLLTNLPSNILISFIFIAIVNDIDFVIGAVPAVPIGMGLNTLFLFIFIITLRYGLAASTIASLLGWLIFAVVASMLSFANLWINVILYFVLTIAVFMILERRMKIPSADKSKKRYTPFQLFLRAVFAGGVVASVIVVSKFFNPYITGIFATFPAVLLSTMVILVINQNREFAQATGKVLVISSSNIIIYVVAVYFTFPVFGIAMGTIISFVCAFLWVLLFSPVVKRLG